MDDEKDLDKKLAEFDQQVTPQYLYKLAKVKLAERILKGDTDIVKDFENLKNLEARINAAEAPAAATGTSSSQSPSSASATGEGDTPSEEDELGIDPTLRVKRHYKLSEEAIEQRRAAARRERPDAAGNKNAWKHGRFAKDFVDGRIKPCLSTCPDFADCALVNDGYTKPGGVCYDKAAVIAIYTALQDAIKNKKYDDFDDVSALFISEAMHNAMSLMEDCIRDGGVVLRRKTDKNGAVTEEYVPHPALLAIPKFIADLGITPREMLATPKSRNDNKNEEEKGKTLAGIMSDLNRRQRDRADQKGDDAE